MDLEQIRRMVITALFSDDVLVEKLVLKGGNALRLVYGIGSRSSMDIDVSIDKDFEDPPDVERRLRRVLTQHFTPAGYEVFDIAFNQKPASALQGSPPNWGGYELVFKLIERAKFDALKGDIPRIRRDATVIGPESKRIFRVEFSKYEFVAAGTEVDWDDGYVIRVAKLGAGQAGCQYTQIPFSRRTKHSRANFRYDGSHPTNYLGRRSVPHHPARKRSSTGLLR